MAHFAPSFAEAWSRHDDFVWQPSEHEDQPCVYAQQFATQAVSLYQPALQDPSHISLNQALLQVCKKYWEWFYVVPKRHRIHVEGRQHHCIHAEFRQIYERLKVVELSLAPPMLFLPPPPAPPTPPVVKTFAGITLGEVLGEEE